MKKTVFLVFITMLVLALMAGCSAGDVNAGEKTQEETFHITGLEDGDIAVTMSEIRALEPYEGSVEGANSEGEPVEYDVKGAYFEDLLQMNGYAQSDLAGIRVVASDGYSIEVAGDILAARDVIIAYEMDGELLDAKNAPFRVFIPEERAMYWVRMVTQIDVINVAVSGEVNKVFIMETLYSSEDYEDYEFIGQIYQALDTKTILRDHTDVQSDVVLMTAQDGLEKNETLENFYKGVINFTGETSPEFFSSTLPVGMFVKNLKLIKYGGNAFYFAAKEAAEGEFTLKDLLEASGMTAADQYTVVFEDETQELIAAEDMALWTVGIEEQGVFISKDDRRLMNPVSIN